MNYKPLSKLVNGVVSWPDKIDPSEKLRQEKYEKGEGYYEQLN